ncbi:MAG: hypothetical protein WCJ32_08555 [Actinomycetota bacterium]
MHRTASFIAASVFAAALALGAPPVAVRAAGGGRVAFKPPVRLTDTRSGPLVSDIALPTNAIVRVIVGTNSSVPTSGTAALHNCGSPVGASPPSLQFTNFDTAEVKVTTGANTCLGSSVPMYVVVDQIATIATSATDGLLQYDAVTPQILADATINGAVTLGRGSIPADAAGVVLKIDIPSPTQAGAITGYDCAGAKGFGRDVVYDFTHTVGLAYIAFTNPTDAPCVFASTAVQATVSLLGYFSNNGPVPDALPPTISYQYGSVPAPGLRPITPVRVLDTRIGQGRPGTAPVPADGVVTLAFGDKVGSSSAAVVINLTVVSPAGPGFATVYPCDSARPKASNLNYIADQIVPNLVVAALSADRTVCIYTLQSAHFVVDLSGTFETNGGAHARPIAPERLLDTRSGVGVPSAAPLNANTPLALTVTGHATVPDHGAQAVTLNVTVTNPVGDSFLTVWPCDQTQPLVSNLNFVKGQTVPNLVTVAVSANGTVCFASPVQTDVLADISMWFANSETIGFKPLAPVRLLDSRSAIGTETTTPVPAGGQQPIIPQHGGVPFDAVAVAVNLTVTEPTSDGFATAWPCPIIVAPPPVVSNLNFVKGQTVANAATVQLYQHDDFCIAANSTSHFVVDVNGYYTDTRSNVPVPTVN